MMPTKRLALSSNALPDLFKDGKGEEMFLTNRKPLLALLMVILLGSSLALAQKGPVEFSLRSTDGQTVTSESLHGEVVVLAFGASWLPLSKTQLQGVRKLADEYSDRGVVVYWVSTESEDPKSKNFASDDQLRAFAQKYGLKVTVLRDPDGVISKKFGIDQLPSMVIIDKQGHASEPIGGLDPNGNLAGQLASRLDKVL
jgi:cytochrome c biogenesis protein CcmG, thiol:disulfide interchange protein DsbE